MKIYAVGATPEELEKIEGICRAEGWAYHPHSGFGRRKANYPVQIVLDAYEQHGTARAAARVAEVSPGTAYRILKQAGMI